MDPVTREKLQFNPSPVTDGLFTTEQLLEPGGWGGSIDFVYEHQKYFRHMVGMCMERKEEQVKAWREMGGGVGASEWDLKTNVEGTKSERKKI